MTADTHSVLSGLKPLSRLDHPREMIRQFTPNWFAATMGTGILALALPQVPGIGPSLKPVGEVLWFFNIALFALFAGLYGARWVMFGHEARRIFGHNTVSMFIGTIPMGLATIINGCLAFGIARFGNGIVPVAHVLWWIDAAMSLACGVLIPYMMFTRHEHSLDGMTAVWLLPVVAAEVAGASGGLLAPHLADPHAQLVTLATSYVLWAYSVPVAFGILAILILRMALHKPQESMAASSGWRWDRSARVLWACWCSGRTRRRSSRRTGWPVSVPSRKGSALWPDSACGASACGGWRSRRSSPSATGALASRSTWAGGAIPFRSASTPSPPSASARR
jgi:hypothetical protein